MTHGIVGPDRDVAGLAGAVVVTGDETIVVAGEDDFRILRISRNPARFAATDGIPVGLANAGAGSAGHDLDGGVVLLCAVDPVGELIVQGDAIELGGGLVHDAGPGLAAVETDVGAAIVAFNHAIRVGRRDPQLVIVAVRRVQGDREGVAAIDGLEEPDVDAVNHVFVLGVGRKSGCNTRRAGEACGPG